MPKLENAYNCGSKNIQKEYGNVITVDGLGIKTRSFTSGLISLDILNSYHPQRAVQNVTPVLTMGSMYCV